MKPEQVQKVLDGEQGVKAEGKGVYVVGETLDLTVVFEMGQEPLSVGRVKRLVLQPDLTTVETHKGERLYTSAPLRAIKLGSSESGKARGTGFTASR